MRPAGFELTARPAPLRELLGEVWANRGLITTLARKEFFVRYRRASFGVLWAVGLPLIQALVLTVVFSRIVKVGQVEKFPVFVFTGMIPWAFFSAVASSASTSVVDNAQLASKIYFPRICLPLVTVLANAYSFGVSLAILVVLSLVFQVAIGPTILLLVPGTLLLFAWSLAFTVLASGLHVYFRDVRFIVQASLIAWFYVTPIFYPIALANGALSAVLHINPMTGIVETFRAATVGAESGAWVAVGLSCAWTFVVLGAGLLVHQRRNRLFTDLL